MKNKQSKNTFFVAYRLLRGISFERNGMPNNEVRVIIVSSICEINWYRACFKRLRVNTFFYTNYIQFMARPFAEMCEKHDATFLRANT